MTRLTPLVLGLLSSLQSAEALADEPSQVEGSLQDNYVIKSAAETRRTPILLLAPTADVAVGHHSFFSTQLGGAAFVAVTPQLRLGLSAALSKNVTNSMEGCSVVETCVRSWKRVAASLEYHHFPESVVDFWWGVQTGTEWRQAEVRQSTAQWENDKRVFALLQPNVGVDFVAAFGRGVVGVGVYAGVPLSLGSNESSIGGLLGVRGLLGVN
jgi:hypothetical protein